MALSWPVEAPVSQQFGTNPNDIQPNGHTGIDFAVPIGTPIYAADSGNVMFSNWSSTLAWSNPWWIAPPYAGIVVVIDHNDGFATLYGHLNETHLNDGEFVEKGALIGYSGSTGLSTGPHLHFEVLGWPLQPYNGFYGRLNPNLYCGGFAKAPELAGNQRIVGQYGAKERTAASTDSAEGRVFKHGDVLTFKGFVRGQNVNGSDIWFVGAFSGTFFHSSAFDDSGTHDLQDITPPPAPVTVGVNQRRVGAAVIRYRKAANTSAEIIQEYAPGEILNFSHWTRGQDVGGNNVWFKGAISGGYAWSGGFEDKSTNGLAEEVTTTPSPAPAPSPSVPENLPTPAYTFVKDFDFVEYRPAHITNVQAAYDNPGVTVFPEKPEYQVIHQFDARSKNPSIDGVIAHFATERPGMESSAHFSVSGQRIVQHVSLKDRAYHAGKVGNNYVGIETDPDQDPETIASVKKLLKAINEKYGYELKRTLHKDVPGNSTNCGVEINLNDYKLETPAPIPVPTPAPEPAPTPVPETKPEPTPVLDEEEVPVDEDEEFAILVNAHLESYRQILYALKK
jgi:hypothetical protein